MKFAKRIPLNLQLFAEGDPAPQDPKPADPNPTDPPKTDDKTVPYERFKSVNDALGAFKAHGTPEEIATRLARLAELEKAAEDAEKAKLSEIERERREKEEAATKATDLEKRLTEAEQARLNDRIEFAIERHAKDAVDMEAVLAFVDRSALKVEGNTVTGVEEAIEALKASKPYLFAKVEPAKPKQIGDQNNPPKDGDVNTLEAQLDLAKKANDFSKVIELSNKIKQHKK